MLAGVLDGVGYCLCSEEAQSMAGPCTWDPMLSDVIDAVIQRG